MKYTGCRNNAHNSKRDDHRKALDGVSTCLVNVNQGRLSHLSPACLCYKKCRHLPPQMFILESTQHGGYISMFYERQGSQRRKWKSCQWVQRARQNHLGT